MPSEESRRRNRQLCADYRRRFPQYHRQWKVRDKAWKQSAEYAALMAPTKQSTKTKLTPSPQWETEEGYSTMSFFETEESTISIKATGSMTSKAHRGAPNGQTALRDHQTTATTKTSHRTSFLEAEIADDASVGSEVISFETPTVALPPNSYAIDNITLEGNEDGLFEAVESEGTVTVKVADELSIGQFDIVVCMAFLPTNPFVLKKAPQVISRQQRVRVGVEAA